MTPKPLIVVERASTRTVTVEFSGDITQGFELLLGGIWIQGHSEHFLGKDTHLVWVLVCVLSAIDHLVERGGGFFRHLRPQWLALHVHPDEAI